MNTAEIDSRSVARIVSVAIAVVAVAAALAFVVVEVRQTLRWLAAAIFLALALAPLVGAIERIRVRGSRAPRWAAVVSAFAALAVVLGVLVLHVIPPMVEEVEQLGGQAPGYVRDFERWANDSEAFRELNQRYDLTATLNKQTSDLPSRLGDAANELKVLTVAVLRNALAAITVLVLAAFLLLEGRGLVSSLLGRLGPRHAATGERIAARIYEVVRGYVTINVALAVAAGVFTWVLLELIGVEVAVPLAILVGFLNLVPLIGLTIGGAIVAIAAGLHSFPGGLIAWVLPFLVYQQLQDRVIQPMLYGHAVRISPLVAIVALLAGAQLAGFLGALIAIPVAASLLAAADELSSPSEPEPGGGGEAPQTAAAS